MIILFIGADGKILNCFHFQICHYLDIQVDGAEITARHSGGLKYLLIISKFDLYCSQHILQFDRLHLMVTSDQHSNRIAVCNINHGLDQLFRRYSQEFTNCPHLSLARSFNLLQWQQFCIR